MSTEKRYWFHTKNPQEGIGGSSPASWQGWVALALFLSFVLISSLILLPERFGTYLLVLGALAVLFSGICFVKGAPVRGK